MLVEPEQDAERLALDRAVAQAVRARLAAGARPSPDADAIALRETLAGLSAAEAAAARAVLGRIDAASGAPLVGVPGEQGLGTIRQGYLEESAVDPVREISELIKAQRGYELNSKVITAADQMLGATVQVR